MSGRARAGLIVVVALAGSIAPAARAEDACGRSCLAAWAGDYMQALARHDPASLKWSPDAIFTENGVRLKPGEALWATVSEVTPTADLVIEPETGGVAFTTSVAEGGRPAQVTVRLLIDRGALAEAETVVARKETTTFLATAPIPAEPPSPTSQPRAELVALARGYLVAVSDPAAAAPTISGRCNRIENGVQTTNNPDPLPGVSPAPLRSEMTSLGCAEQFERGLLRFITGFREARFPVVDRQRGIVQAMLIFDHDGKPHPARGGRPALSAGLSSPYSYVVAERFQIEPDGIGRIDATLTLAPFGFSVTAPFAERH
jgi:hypothetical protein